MSWERDGRGLGRVVNHCSPGTDLATIALPISLRLTKQRRVLGLPTERKSPATGWRMSKYAKKGIKRPRHPRIKLREKVAREAREIQTLARHFATAAVETAAQAMLDPTEPLSARLQAAALILDRAYGKAVQPNTNMNVDANGKPREVTSSELDRRINETLAAVERITGRAGKAPKGKEQPADLRQRNRNPDGSDPQLH